MKIRAITVANYRCLRNVHLSLAPLTVLVGPNGSGKTALLEALDSKFSFAVEKSWHKLGGRCTRSWTLGNRSLGDEDLGPGEQTSAPWKSLHLHLRPEALRERAQVSEARSLDPTGSNLVNVFATLPRRVQEQIAQKMRELVPLYADVHARPAERGSHRLVFQDRWNDSVWYEPSEVSDGSILLLAFLTLPHMTPPVDLVTIEEPEHALHPYLLSELVTTLRALAQGELAAQPVQVVLATHSAQLLNFLEASEVRFIKRDLESGATVVEAAPTESKDWQAACEAYQNSLGEMWLAGGLGGVPGVLSDR